MQIAEIEEIVQLDEEDIEAMRDDAKAAEEEDYQQYMVYGWERSMNAKHTVSNKVDYSEAAKLIYKTSEWFDIEPPEYYIESDLGPDVAGRASRTGRTMQLFLHKDAPPWVALHEMAHIITYHLEDNHRCSQSIADDYDGWKWAGHGSVFVGIFRILMRLHGFWPSLNSDDMKGLRYVTEDKLLELGYLPTKLKLLERWTVGTETWRRWMMKEPSRAPALVNQTKDMVDSYAKEYFGRYSEEFGLPSRHFFHDLEAFSMESHRMHLEDEAEGLIEKAHQGCFGYSLGDKDAWSLENDDEERISMVADSAASELLGEYEEMLFSGHFDFDELMEYLEERNN